MGRRKSRFQEKIDDPSATLLDVLTADELKLFGYPGEGLAHAWREVEEFKANALDLWGLSWPQHVPKARECPLNAIFLYLWREVMWTYQLCVVYSPFASAQILGARGTGKTSFFAKAGATHVGFHPGENWLGCAPSQDQADLQQQIIMSDGTFDEDKRDFRHLFITHDRSKPHAYLEFRKWDQWDPGSTAKFRSTGKPNEPGELLRSHEVGLITVDEAFRTFLSDWAIRTVAGCLRGLNKWRANQNPRARDKWLEMAMEMDNLDTAADRERHEKKMDDFARKHNMAKLGLMWVGGNAGFFGWPYHLQQMAERGQRPWYAPTWKTKDNPAYTRSQRASLEEKFRNDPDGLAMETEAKRPPPPGQIYTLDQIDGLFSGELDAELIAAVEAGKPGYSRQVHEECGVYQFAFPPKRGHIYVGGGDGGTAQIPNRNKWCVMVWDISVRPFQCVYFEMGQVGNKGTGSIIPWLRKLFELCQNDRETYYPIPHAGLWVDSTGLQSHVYETAATWSWSQPVEVWGFDMQMKMPLIMKSQILLSEGLLVSPTVEQWESEMGVYDLPDSPPMEQDIVMAMLAASAAMWEFKHEELHLELSEERREQGEAVAAWKREKHRQGRYGSVRRHDGSRR